MMASRRFLTHLSLAMALAVSATGCTSADRIVTGSTYPKRYEERHPIVLTQAPRKLDVFVGRGRGGLDERQRDDVRSFGVEYLAMGKGGIRAMVPAGNGQDAWAHQTLNSIRSVLGANGVRSGVLSVARYTPQDPSVAAPVRLVFQTLQAKVASQCGLWPDDLGPGPSIQGWRNDPYWNFGCATQTNTAAQIADPLDLVRARPEGRIDTLKRSKNIETIRDGKDPSTVYNTGSAQTSQSVGSN